MKILIRAIFCTWLRLQTFEHGATYMAVLAIERETQTLEVGVNVPDSFAVGTSQPLKGQAILSYIRIVLA